MPGSLILKLFISIVALFRTSLAVFDASGDSTVGLFEVEGSDESCGYGADVVLLQTNLALLQSQAIKVEEAPDVPSVAGNHQGGNHNGTTASLVLVGAKIFLKAMIYPDEVSMGSPDIDLHSGTLTVAGLLCVTLLFWVLVSLLVSCTPTEWQATCTQWLNISMCFLLLAVSLCSYGVLQEFIMTTDYRGERFPSAAFLIVVNRIFVVTVASALLAFRGESFVTSASMYASIPAATIFLSSWCQHGSLRFISFPTQMVFKSCKIVPTMGVNTLLNNQRHSSADYGYAVIITACVVGFTAASATWGSDAAGKPLLGVLMMLFFLLCDSLTSNAEKRIYNSWREFDNVQMMLAVGFFSLIYSILGLMATFSFGEMHAFIVRNPECITQIVLLAITSMCGQYLIFYIIRAHGPVAFSVMMTIRQMFSLAISAVLFVHPLGVIQTTCAVVSFAVLLMRPLLKLFMKRDALDEHFETSNEQDKKLLAGRPR